jgi:hypothetical protein
MATKTKNTETFYAINVLAVNVKIKETGKSLAGASKIVLTLSKDINLNSDWIQFLQIAIGNSKSTKQKEAYELLKSICKPNHISKKYSAFYILQGLNRGNGKIVELLKGKKPSPQANKLVAGKPVTNK